MLNQATEDFLEHFGVVGMKWGRRRSRPTESRRDYKQRIRTERDEFDRAHLGKVITTSMKKGEKVLVKTQLPNDYAVTIMTGKQFVEMAGRGTALSARTTDIFATLDPKVGKFVLNENPNQGYKPTERR
jgi:hypothetical protein